MKLLNRYIAKEVLKGSLVAATVLVTVLFLWNFTEEMGDMEGDYGIKQILIYLGLVSPRDFYELLPSSVLLGSLVTLGGLANNRELVAMQAAGASKFRIIWAVMRAGLILAIFSSLVGEYMAPASHRAALAFKSIATKQQVASRTRYGFWLRNGNTYINIRQIEQQDNLGDISIFDFDKDLNLVMETHAEKAIYENNKWRLENIKITRINQQSATSESKPIADWASVLAPDLLNVFVAQPDNLSAYELWNYMAYLESNGQKNPSIDLAFWGRIVNPFVTLAMLLLATPFVMTLRRETSLGQRIVIGVVFGIGFWLVDQLVGHYSLIYQFNPMLSASLPTLLVFAGAFTAIFRLR